MSLLLQEIGHLISRILFISPFCDKTNASGDEHKHGYLECIVSPALTVFILNILLYASIATPSVRTRVTLLVQGEFSL